MHRVLAGALFYLRDSSGALAELERARELYAGLGCSDPHPYLDSNFGSVLARLGRHDDAIAHHRRALELYRAAGFRLGEAFALLGIGSCANRLGHHEQAIVSVTDALRIYQELDHPDGEASSMASLARSYHLVGYLERAAQFAVRALELHRAMGSGVEVARVLTTLGDIRAAAGDRIAADALFRAALAILDELRLPQADDLRDRLASTSGQPGAPARIASA